MKLSLRLFIYAGLGLFSFTLFLMMLFPYDSIRGRLVREVENSLGSGYQVSIGKLRPYPLLGLSLRDVAIKQNSLTLVKINKALLSFKLLPFLWGSFQVNFDFTLDKSEVEGFLAISKSNTHIDWELNDFNFKDLGYLASRYGLNLTSRIDGKGSLELFPQDPLKTTGRVVFAFKEMKLLESEMKIGEGESAIPFSLPLLQMAGGSDKSGLEILIDKGSMEFKTIELKGPDLFLSLAGKVYMSQNWDDSRFSLTGNFGVSPAAGSKLPLLALVDKEKGIDGKFPLVLTGRLNKPNIQIGSTRLPF
ncbi:MAG: type II secretion system protein GspN [Deltaproteobacteria bacterium]|nr:type II secretion system protein GspN [Deltaproteobacteria bacterium]